MTRVDIEKGLIKSANGANLLGRKDIGLFMGCHGDNKLVRELIRGLPKINGKYFAKDLSERIFERQKMA